MTVAAGTCWLRLPVRIIDRIGAHSALITAAAIGVMVNSPTCSRPHCMRSWPSAWWKGLVVVGIYSAAPALIMATAGAGAPRSRHGGVVHLYARGHVAGSGSCRRTSPAPQHWRGGYLIHLILFGALLVAGGGCPASPALGSAACATAGCCRRSSQAGPVRAVPDFLRAADDGFRHEHGVP